MGYDPLKAYKERRNAINETAKAQQERPKPVYERDERFWYPTVADDKKKESVSLIRFVPGKMTENAAKEPLSIVRRSTHKVGSKTIACPKDIGKPCKFCEHGWKLWRKTKEETGAGERNDFMPYEEMICNIYVKADKNCPDNNGKVFLYRLPVIIKKRIQAKLEVSDEFNEQVPVFDLFDGAYFKLVTADKGGYMNYETSEFMTKIEPAGSEEVLRHILENSYDLEEVMAETSYLPEDEFNAMFAELTNLSDEPAQQKQETETKKPVRTSKKREKVEEEEEEEVSGIDSPLDDDDIPF